MGLIIESTELFSNKNGRAYGLCIIVLVYLFLYLISGVSGLGT